MVEPRTVRFQGRDEPVIGERWIGRRRYLLLRQLNQGEAEAYLAFDAYARPGGGFFAIHVLPRSRATEQRITVLDRLSRRGGHFPNVAAFQRTKTESLVAVDWVEGQNLRTFLKGVRSGANRRPSAVEASTLVAKLAHGIAHLHGKANCIHGDIKPANMILSSNSLRMVLIDFGSAWPARRTVRRETGDGMTAPYAAPEQLADGVFVDWRADIFGLSVVWYEMLTLQIPYDGLGGRAGLAEYRPTFEAKLVPPSKLMANHDAYPIAIRERIDAAVCRGLALDADGRFPDRRSWLDELDGIRTALRSPESLRDYSKSCG